MVDLLDHSSSTEISGGIVELRDGTRFYSMFVGRREDGNIAIRIGKGEYAVYTRDGRLNYKNGDVYHPYDNECIMDVVGFNRCYWYDPESFGLAHDYHSARPAHLKDTSGPVSSAL